MLPRRRDLWVLWWKHTAARRERWFKFVVSAAAAAVILFVSFCELK